MMRSVAPFLLLLCGLNACESPQETSAYPVIDIFKAGSGERIVHAVAYDTVWTFGGGADTLLVSPIELAATPDGGLYVMDPGSQQVHRFTANGRHAWSWGKKGEGPRELMNVRAMAASPAGGIVLVDSRNRRIVSVSADGVWEREVRLEKLEGDVQHVIPLSSGNYLLTTTGEEPFPVVSAEGTTIGALPSPWPEGFGQMHAIQLQGRAVHWQEDRWVFGFTAGNGWFTFDGVGEGSLRGTYPYVEHAEFPGLGVQESRDGNTTIRSTGMLSRPSWSGYDLGVRGDTLLVLPGGSSPIRLRVLDKYDLQSGAYLGSQELPGPATRFAGHGDVLFIIDTFGLLPIVTSLRARAPGD